MKNYIFLSLFLVATILFSSYANSDTITSPPKKSASTISELAGVLSYAKGTRISHDGSKVVFLTRNDFAKFHVFESMSGAQGAIVNWPEPSKQLTGKKIPISDLQGVVFDTTENSNNAVANGFLGNSLMIKYNGKDDVSIGEDFGTVIGEYAIKKNYVNISNFNAELDTSLIDKMYSFQASNNALPNYFKPTETYDGLVERILFNNKVYEIGSNQGRDLLLKWPDGTINRLDDRIDAIGFNNFSIVELKDGQLAITAQGLLYPINKTGNTKPLNIPMYAKVVNTPNSKNVSYIYNSTDIKEITPSKAGVPNEVKNEVRQWVSKNWLLTSASMDQKAQKFVLLFRAPSNLNLMASSFINRESAEPIRYIFSNNSSMKITSSGNFQQQYNYNAEEFKNIPKLQFKTTFDEINKSGHRVGITTINPNKSIIGTYVFIRGGPMVNNYLYFIAPLEERLLNDGWRIIHLEYSGAISTSVQTYSNLHSDRNKAMKIDAELFSERIKNINGNKPIVLVGNSFGSALTSYIAPKLQRNSLKIILTMPAGNDELKLSSAEDAEDRILRQVTMAGYGSPIDGVGSNINEWWASNISRLCNHTKIKAYFGERDKLVSTKPWLEKCGAKLDYEIISNTYHFNTTELDNKLYNDVATWMEKIESKHKKHK